MIRIATRNSQLALWQAEYIRRLLLSAHSDLQETDIVLVPLASEGDIRTEEGFERFGYKGIFTKRIEQALLNNDADIAVHSMKDVASVIPDALTLAAMPEREDVRDAWISPRDIEFENLAHNALVGTASIRRTALLRHHFPQLRIEPLRGNVPTRLEKAAQFDGIILAAAGLKRLKLEEHITNYLPVEQFLPAAGQGAVGVQCRSDDMAMIERLHKINHPLTFQAVTAERAALAVIDGDCTTPVGGYAQYQQDKLHLTLRYLMPEGGQVIEVSESGTDPLILGSSVGAQVKDMLACCS
ncbi:MAG: hydroxymethylbilane synthase [Rickettsiales bacterium]|nr:hydroxymethylbilane synthase [Rickettsiales bacterium]|tara:strand:- start:2583 stop:3476 length:894 start_codon:yes stop_codon:yes gene_type:complete